MHLKFPSLLSSYFIYCLCCQYNYQGTTCLAASINNNVNSNFIDAGDAGRKKDRKTRGSSQTRIITEVSEDDGINDAEAHQKYQKNDPVEPHVENEPLAQENSGEKLLTKSLKERSNIELSEDAINSLYDIFRKHGQSDKVLDTYCRTNYNIIPESAVGDSHSVEKPDNQNENHLESAMLVNNKQAFREKLLDILNQQNVKNPEPAKKVTILEGILVKIVGVFGMVGLIAMALFANKSKRRQEGIPRSDSKSDSCSTNLEQSDSYMIRGDSHENSHLQSTLFLNHEDRDSRNLQSVSSSIDNSC